MHPYSSPGKLFQLVSSGGKNNAPSFCLALLFLVPSHYTHPVLCFFFCFFGGPRSFHRRLHRRATRRGNELASEQTPLSPLKYPLFPFIRKKGLPCLLARRSTVSGGGIVHVCVCVCFLFPVNQEIRKQEAERRNGNVRAQA